MVTVPVLLAGGQRRGAENHNGSGQAESNRGDEQPAVGFGSSQHRSDLAPTRVQGTRRFVECPHQLLEDAAAMLVIFKLIETRAGWCEEHRIAFSRALVGQL